MIYEVSNRQTRTSCISSNVFPYSFSLSDKTLPRYAFRMILRLTSTSRGKWNKMDCLEYCSINLQNGEVMEVPKKHQRPFYFSTVRSYGV